MRFKVLLTLPLFAVALVALACGGGSSGGGGSDESAAGAAANQHIKTMLGLFDGSTSGKELINVFAPECRKDVDASQIDGVAALIRAFVPDLSKNKIEAVDLGKLTYEKASDGIMVKAQDSNAVRIKSKGKWMSADDYFASAGLSDTSGGIGVDEGTLLVKRDGKWYIGDCSMLEDFSSGFN